MQDGNARTAALTIILGLLRRRSRRTATIARLVCDAIVPALQESSDERVRAFAESLKAACDASRPKGQR